MQLCPSHTRGNSMKTKSNVNNKVRNISGCMITLDFSHKDRADTEKYVIGSLMQSFEKRNNICGDSDDKFA